MGGSTSIHADTNFNLVQRLHYLVCRSPGGIGLEHIREAQHLLRGLQNQGGDAAAANNQTNENNGDHEDPHPFVKLTQRLSTGCKASSLLAPLALAAQFDTLDMNNTGNWTFPCDLEWRLEDLAGSEYEKMRLHPWNSYFHAFPRFIVQPRTDDDVKAIVDFVQEYNSTIIQRYEDLLRQQENNQQQQQDENRQAFMQPLKICVCSGGAHSSHSMIDNACVIDMSLRRNVQFAAATAGGAGTGAEAAQNNNNNTSNNNVIICDSGAQLRDAGEFCKQNRVTFPMGTSASNGLCGMALCGGTGHRLCLGDLTMDRVVGLDVVLADGRVVEARRGLPRPPRTSDASSSSSATAEPAAGGGAAGGDAVAAPAEQNQQNNQQQTPQDNEFSDLIWSSLGTGSIPGIILRLHLVVDTNVASQKVGHITVTDFSPYHSTKANFVGEWQKACAELSGATNSMLVMPCGAPVIPTMNIVWGLDGGDEAAAERELADPANAANADLRTLAQLSNAAYMRPTKFLHSPFFDVVQTSLEERQPPGAYLSIMLGLRGPMDENTAAILAKYSWNDIPNSDKKSVLIVKRLEQRNAACVVADRDCFAFPGAAFGLLVIGGWDDAKHGATAGARSVEEWMRRLHTELAAADALSQKPTGRAVVGDLAGTTASMMAPVGERPQPLSIGAPSVEARERALQLIAKYDPNGMFVVPAAWGYGGVTRIVG